MMGKSIPPDLRAITAADLKSTLVNNGINHDAQRIEANLQTSACEHERLFVADSTHIVGLLRKVGPQRWRGAALAAGDVPLRILEPSCG